jgi:hypothetical protein
VSLQFAWLDVYSVVVTIDNFQYQYQYQYQYQ